jgi:hypothetical protein
VLNLLDRPSARVTPTPSASPLQNALASIYALTDLTNPEWSPSKELLDAVHLVKMAY